MVESQGDDRVDSIVYRYVWGEVRVDLTGSVCPEVIDVPGCSVLKKCRLQECYVRSPAGVLKKDHRYCTARVYAGDWENCAIRRRK